MTDRRIGELVAFAANGTLDAKEQAELDAALAADEALQRDLQFARVLRAEVKAREVPNTPGEFGLARLKRAIAAEAPAPAPVQRTNWWKVAAVAACALFAVQTAAVLTAPNDVVRLAGGGGAVVEGPVLTVAFLPAATEADMRAALLEAGVSIVEGPSALGLYRVAPLEGTDAAAAEAALRASASVESVAAE